MISIFSYLDYIKFLHDLFVDRKKDMKFFSHRYLSLRIGLKSSGHILYVMQGKRRLTENVALKIAEFLKFTKNETDYFKLLVHYENAKKADEKQYFFERMALLRKKVMKKVPPRQYQFYEKWYYSAILEIIAIIPFKDDFAMLARSLIPAISVKEAKAAVRLLEKLGLIIPDERGWYAKADTILTAGAHWYSSVIRNLQSTFIDMSKEALTSCPPSIRDISTCTVSISESSLELIREKIDNLRSEILSIAALDEKPEHVYQCNFQVFPLFRKEAEKKDEN